jgi:fluoride ion exporter CrcB/FEX
MSHFPSRQAPGLESPPTAFVDMQALSPLSESWNEISNQFEESVGKPSREAVHKFFYPHSNNNCNNNNNYKESQNQSFPNRCIDQATLSSRDMDKMKVNSQKQPSQSYPNNAASERRNQQVTSQGPTSSCDSTNDSHFENDSQEHPQSVEDQQRQNPPSRQQLSQPTMSGNSSSIGYGEWSPSPPSVSFQRSFTQEEEQDRKYVERFWTTYDDLVILSLFTQIGVVARLAASTWFTFFDGVFRSDSPLFTVLPLNCLSCFLLGILGSGDRLMEMVTTRFTPRNLQQCIVDHREYAYDIHTDKEHDGYCDNGENDANQLGGPKEGLHHRRRRPKRATRNKPFHSWEPPLHWHDDLREVQLLALERRIRASKCLLLFPVAKEDADVMEHYFGEGYKASDKKQQHSRHQSQTLECQHQHQQQQQQQQQKSQVSRRLRRRRQRSRFGRQKYSPTNLTDNDPDIPQSHANFDERDSGDDSDYNDADRGLDDCGSGDEADIDNEFNDGLFRFDLELTESTEMAIEHPGDIDVAANGVNSPSSAGSLPLSVQKLIKRSPGLSPSFSNKKIGSPELTSHLHPQSRSASNLSQGESEPEISQPTARLGENYPLEAALDELGCPLPSAPQHYASPLATSNRTPESPVSARAEAIGLEAGDPHLEQIISNVQANVSENISRLGRVNLADGWDVGTTPDAMADDLTLGLRDGFCGALSSFSSWNSSMLNLLREGHVGEAVVGCILGIQLPIVAYRFGQQSAVYFFVWRCRREARCEARKGWYGIRVKMEGSDDESESGSRPGSRSSPGEATGTEEFVDACNSAEANLDENALSRDVPSVRAICTALYLLALVTQFTSLSFFANPEYQQIALSLLFSPVGTLTRWRLSQLNCWRAGFPIGTFACNILACAINGSLGSLLAGNPGPKERIILQGLIAGFGVSLSSLATFIVEILAGMDPLLLRFDGVIYAVCSIAWALIVGFLFSASVDWADETS